MIITCKDVNFRYNQGPLILKNITFSIAPGSMYFLTGPSGAGKSSILKMLYGALKPTSGSLKIFSKDASALTSNDIAEIRQNMGIVFQDFNLLPHKTILENVMLPLRIKNSENSQNMTQAIELLRWVGITCSLDKFPNEQSGGEQQRIAIARAVINNPSIIIADEPTGSVDEQMALKLLYLFHEMKSMGTAVIIATHQRDLAKTLGYPEMFLSDGILTLKE